MKSDFFHGGNRTTFQQRMTHDDQSDALSPVYFTAPRKEHTHAQSTCDGNDEQTHGKKKRCRRVEKRGG